MPRFQDLPIRHKLMLFIVLVSAFCVLAAVLAVVGYENSILKRRAVRDLRARAEMIAAATEFTLDFNDRKVAREVLQRLIASPEIRMACIYAKDGTVFASYVRPGVENVTFPAPRPESYEFEDHELRLFHRLRSDQEEVGTVFLESSLRPLATQVRTELLLYTLGTLFVVGLAFLVSTVLQRTISTPIMRLATAARRIAQGDYSVRVTQETNDEIGQLTATFNQMLDIIAARRDAVNRANEELAQELAERKQAQAALQESQAELTQLNLELEHRVAERTAKLEETVGELRHISYSLTHDMRAPLRAMHGFAELLMEECGRNVGPQGQKSVELILASAARLDILIQDAFDYTQVAGAPLKLQRVDTERLLTGMVSSYPQFQQPKAEIHLAADLPVVLGNEALLTQCFSNLLSNALKFTRPGVKPVVNIRAEPRDATVRFWIEDNGIGIPKEAQGRIFAMFQRAHSGYEGTGIGLAIVRKAIERMGGKVGVLSEPGQGSRFWVELRASEPNATQNDAQELAAHP